MAKITRIGSKQAAPKKTEDLEDLIAWVESFPKRKKKTYDSQHIDEICYGVKRKG